MLPYIDSGENVIVVTVWRLVTDSLFHACTAGVTAYFIGLAYHYRAHRISLMGFGLAFSAVLHGLYDNFASGWVGAALAVVIVLVFVGYVQTGDQIARRFAEQTCASPAPPLARDIAVTRGYAPVPPTSDLPSTTRPEVGGSRYDDDPPDDVEKQEKA